MTSSQPLSIMRDVEFCILCVIKMMPVDRVRINYNLSSAPFKSARAHPPPPPPHTHTHTRAHARVSCRVSVFFNCFYLLPCILVIFSPSKECTIQGWVSSILYTCTVLSERAATSIDPQLLAFTTHGLWTDTKRTVIGQ